MPIVMVDPDDGGIYAGTTPPEPGTVPIVEQLGSEIPDTGECVLHHGKPCILFGDWDYAEDWSGEFVREMHPFLLCGEPNVKISAEEFWHRIAGLRGTTWQKLTN